MHVHVHCITGEAKYWLEPAIELAMNHELFNIQLREIKQIIEAHRDEFKSAWRDHFGS